MIHEMKLREIYFDKIKSGEKIYEIRLNDEKRKLITVDDDIVFKKEPELKEALTAKVKELIHFDSFNDMVNFLPLKDVGFANASKEEVIDIYHQFYSQEDETNYGILAIKIEPMSEND